MFAKSRYAMLLRAMTLATCVAASSAIVLATSNAALSQERAVASEKNPPGDIPDDQVFITYRSPQGFSLKVPEGWARKESSSGVVFEDKYGTIEAMVSQRSVAPTVAGVKASEAPELAKTGRAVTIRSVKDVKLPSGHAVKIDFTSNSAPNPVTNKQIRLENERYLVAGHDKLATLTLSAPAGADNADQWKLMADSFRWN